MAFMVKNREDLQRLALAKGASVTFSDGSKFNTSRTVATVPPKPKLAEAPAPAHVIKEPAPVQDNHAVERLVDAVMDQSHQIASEQARIGIMVTQALAMAAQQTPQQVAPTQPREWIFDVERDAENRMVRVIARPA